MLQIGPFFLIFVRPLAMAPLAPPLEPPVPPHIQRQNCTHTHEMMPISVNSALTEFPCFQSPAYIYILMSNEPTKGTPKKCVGWEQAKTATENGHKKRPHKTATLYIPN